mgnify:FL=1
MQHKTTGRLAKECGVKEWQIRRLFERGFLPELERIGRYRICSVKDLPTIRKALRMAGYLKKSTATVSA